MSVLIKGMQMPKDYSVIVKIFPDGRVGTIPYVQLFKVELIEGTQAVPVPAHGDLIDRDALMKGEGRYIISFGKEGIDVAEIERAPTIIPADEVV